MGDGQAVLSSPSSARSRVRARGGFVLALAGALAMMAGASAPSPFYPVLQERIGFSAGTMTIIFAVYALALLVTLLVAGSLSDHLGRRPVISAGLLILSASMVAFWHADSIGVLIAARIVQGVAAGLLMSSLSAAVVDLEPPTRPGSAAVLNAVTPLAGLAVGALASGLALDRIDDDPLAAVFSALSVLFAVLGALVWLAPETSSRVAGLRASLRPEVGIPAPARAEFLRALPALVAGWATGGLYLSLGAPLVARELDGSGHLSQGLVVTALAAAGSLACFVARGWNGHATTLYGTTALATGTALSLVALGFGSLPGFIAAAVVAGTGFGTSFLGIMRSITPLVGIHQRGELFAAVFVVSYLAFGLPAVVAGYASTETGLAAAAYAYGGAVVLLAAAATILRLRSERSHPSSQHHGP
ncbi:MFS transporter [Nocardioides carbamazepini]|uniref:MFS transporter n=1 Tax=Nocardioides carbamazepini TaxID=2854259 RepID=UPI00214A1B29|nr:MFS transporter [Nocardioides carbamazepini]MCR1785674.1 MFS transporter [Nocardioides carbamazepini]